MRHEYNYNVSVVCPSYNMAHYIENFILSYQKQKNILKELIVVDDCSTDNTVEIVKKYQQTDNTIVLYSLDKNSGSGVAREKGWNLAKGEYIFFADPDDMLAYSYSLAHAYHAAKKFNANVCSGGVTTHFFNDNIKIFFWGRHYRTHTQFVKWNSIFQQLDMWQCLIKKDFLISKNIHFNSSPRSQDGFFILDILANSDKILSIPQYIYSYTIFYRYVNLTKNIIENIFKHEKKQIIEFYKKKLLYKFDPYTFFSPDQNLFPISVSWMSPLNVINKEIAYNLYGIKPEDAEFLLKQYSEISNKFKKYCKKTSFFYLRKLKHVYSIKKNKNLIFNQLSFKFYCWSFNIFKPSKASMNYLRNIENIYLYSYDSNYSYLTSKKTSLKDVHVFCRTADTIVYQHSYPSEKALNIIDDVNYQGLELIIKNSPNIKEIFIRSLNPRIIFIYFYRHPSLLNKVTIDIPFFNADIKDIKDKETLFVLNNAKQINSYSLALNKYFKNYIKNKHIELKHWNLKDDYFIKSFCKSTISNNCLLYIEHDLNRAIFNIMKILKEKQYNKIILINSSYHNRFLNVINSTFSSCYYLTSFNEPHINKTIALLESVNKIIYNKTYRFDIDFVVTAIANNINISSDNKITMELINEIKLNLQKQ